MVQYLLLMFRLPNNSESFQKIKSFSSYMFNSKLGNNIQRPSSSISHRRSNDFYQNHYTRQMDNLSRSKSFTSKSKSLVRCNANITKLLQSNTIPQSVLISPSNKKFKYCIRNSDEQHINKKMNKTNFLIQPCKISSIPIQARKQLARQFPLPVYSQKYSSPYSSPFNTSSFVKNNPKIKSGRIREKIQSKTSKKEQQIDAWQIGDCYFQSIKLNPKLSET